jgi:hypothetical protein
MSLEERGLLWTMLCQIWVSRSLPIDPSLLAQLLGTDPQATRRALTAGVLRAFQDHKDSRLICPELDALRAQYEARARERSRSGKRGADSRWRDRKSAVAEPMAEASARVMGTPEMRRHEMSGDELKGKRPVTADLTARL